MSEPAAPGIVTIYPLPGMPELTTGHHLGGELRLALERNEVGLVDGDVLVISSKVISKNSGLTAPASERDQAIGEATVRVVAERRTATGMAQIVESAAGPVMAAAGVDASNTGRDNIILMLPTDPDLAARTIYAELLSAYSPQPLPRIGIVVTDTAGRPWRVGQTDIAIGSCALNTLDDLSGEVDVDGRALAVTARAVADQIAAAGDLVKGKTWATPAAVIRGLPDGTVASPGIAGASHLVRTGPGDWFALGSVEAVRSALGAHPGSGAAHEVGVPTAAPEDAEVRVARAIKLALLGCPSSITAEQVASDQLRQVCTVSGADDFQRGRLSARLEVALASERLISWSVE